MADKTDTAGHSQLRRSRARGGRIVRFAWRWGVRCVIGAAITWALGLLCARYMWDERFHGWKVWRSQTPAVAWPGPVPEGWPESPGRGTNWVSVGIGQLERGSRGSVATTHYTYRVRAFGLPIPALRVDEARRMMIDTYPSDVRNEAKRPFSGREIRRDRTHDWLPTWVMPLVPWWPGFLTNSVVWAFVVAGIGAVLRSARRGNRLKKGRCPWCRAPIGAGPTCERCGRANPGGLCRGPDFAIEAKDGEAGFSRRRLALRWGVRWGVRCTIGAIITIAFGMLCARVLWNDTHRLRTIWKSDRPARVWPGPVPEGWPDSPAAGTEESASQSLAIAPGLLNHTVDTGRGAASLIYELLAFGLPFPALRVDYVHVWNSWNAPIGVHINQARQPWSGQSVYDSRYLGGGNIEIWVIPLLPWWPGFIADTLFFALVVAGVQRLRRSARLARRLSKGKCPKCRYPIGTVPRCSECGEAIPGGLCRAKVE